MPGFCDLYQISSERETTRQKGHIGMFPFSGMTIRRMWERGEFPKPLKLAGRNAWRRDVIDKFAELLAAGMDPAEATIQAAAVV